ncbi:MAG: hypothetical protein ACRCZP_02795, partial [Phycicoccus sp.]
MLRVRRTDGGTAPHWGLVAERAVAILFGIASLPALWGIHTHNGIDLDTGWSTPAVLPFLPAVMVMSAALWWRRTHPVVVGLVVCAAFGVLKASGTGQVPADFLVPLAAEAVGCYTSGRRRATLTAACGTLVVLPLTVRTEWLVGAAAWERVALPTSAVLLLVVLPVTVGAVRRRTRLRLSELEQSVGRRQGTIETEASNRLDSLTPREHE